MKLPAWWQVTTNCAFSVKIMENFKLKSDHLLTGPRLCGPTVYGQTMHRTHANTLPSN